MSPVLMRILQLLVLVLIQAALLFVSAGDLRWQAGWWYIGLYVLMLAGATFVMLPNRREVIEERSKGAKGGKRWDYWLTQLMIIPSLGLLVLAGLDQRWNWTPPLPFWLRLVGGFLFVAGYAQVLWAMYTNKYFSQIVRIQAERGHVAVTSGPYRFIRHPGYLGMMASMLGAVFLLDCIYGLACFFLYLVLIVIRTPAKTRPCRQSSLAILNMHPAPASACSRACGEQKNTPQRHNRRSLFNSFTAPAQANSLLSLK